MLFGGWHGGCDVWISRWDSAQRDLRWLHFVLVKILSMFSNSRWITYLSVQKPVKTVSWLSGFTHISSFAVFLFTINCIWIFIISTIFYHLYQVTVSGDRYQYLWDYQEDYFQMQVCSIRQRLCFAVGWNHHCQLPCYSEYMWVLHCIQTATKHKGLKMASFAYFGMKLGDPLQSNPLITICCKGSLMR